MSKIIKFENRKLKINTKENTIIAGDCIEWLKHIPDSSVDMVYIDPPFFSNKNYEIIWGNGYEKRCFGDRWKGGVKTYITWMEERVKMLHRVLKPTGCIFLHCDHHASHRLRVMLDDVFGAENFINDIAWCYRTGGASKKRFSKKHDNILFYSKSKKYTFNSEKEKIYYGKPFMDTKIEKCPIDTLKQKDIDIITDCLKNKKAVPDRYKDKIFNKYYAEVLPVDWFTKEKPIINLSPERLGYRTQKPESLLKKIIECSTNKGDLVLDCFGGGGTTATVAHKLGRKFITGDVSPVAIRVIAERLNKIENKPEFNIKNVPRTKQTWLDMDGHEFADKICMFMGWEVNPKKSHDHTIDGWAENKKIPIQIKNQKTPTGRPDLQQFVGSMGKNNIGLFVNWEFTKSAWEYATTIKLELKKEVQLISVKDILRDILIDQDKQEQLDKLYSERVA